MRTQACVSNIPHLCLLLLLVHVDIHYTYSVSICAIRCFTLAQEQEHPRYCWKPTTISRAQRQISPPGHYHMVAEATCKQSSDLTFSADKTFVLKQRARCKLTPVAEERCTLFAHRFCGRHSPAVCTQWSGLVTLVR